MINRFARFTIFPEIKKGHKYYYAAKTYRKKINPQHSGKTRGSGKSKVICEKIYLGTAEDVLTKLFSAKTSPQEVSSKEFGLPMSVLKLAHDTGIMDIIDEVLPYKVRRIKASEFIIISAISKLHGSISKDRTGDYFNTTVLPEVMGIKGNNLNSKTYWEMFEKIISEKELKDKKRTKEKQFNDKLSIEELEELIDDEKLEGIEEKIWLNLLQKYHILLDVLLYDGTNCFTYYQDHTINSYGQKGKNKKGRHNLRQIGLFMAVTGDGFPFMSQLTCGNIHDAMIFPTAMSKLIKRYHRLMSEASKIKIAFDKGNNSRKNIMQVSGHEYIGSLVPSSHPDLTSIGLDQYTKTYKGFRVYEGVKEVFGVQHKIIITYNEALEGRQRKSFLRHKTKAKGLLQEEFQRHKTEEDLGERLKMLLHTNKILHSRACRYLDYKIENGSLAIIENEDEIAEKERVFGKNIIFTNNLEAEYSEAIMTYKEKREIEDSFKTIKDHRIISLHPIWHWTDSKIRIDAFISVLAYLLIKLLQYLAKEEGLQMSVASLITALRGIREVLMVYADNTAERKLEELPPLQKQLLHKFGVIDTT
jgi:transposase